MIPAYHLGMLSRLALASLMLAASACTGGPPPAVQAPAASDLASRIVQLDRSTSWSLAAQHPLDFDIHHPQGMVRVGDDWIVSSVEIIERTRPYPKPVDGLDRDAGKGQGHLLRLSPDGKLKAKAVLGEGDMYHPSGLDFDGRHIWVALAEYRPDSRSILYRVDPSTLSAVEVLRVEDHIGGLVHDVEGRSLIGVSWGGRKLYRWPLRADLSIDPRQAALPPAGKPTSHWIAWQDCHYAGARRMLCSGLANYARPGGPNLSLGGLELVDLRDFRSLWQSPLLLWSPTGRAMTQNPAWFEPDGDGLRAWFIPDDGRATLFEYHADLPPS
jgi:hypothetical protein